MLIQHRDNWNMLISISNASQQIAMAVIGYQAW